MNSKIGLQRLSCLAACLLSLPAHAQNIAQPVTFESATVKPAPDNAPTEGLGFMIALGKAQAPRGLLTMTGPLPPFIIFAYGVNDEVEARAMRARLPDWAQHQKFTIVARPGEAAPTTDQIRLMLRSLLEDRFALKTHRETHEGTVLQLSVAKLGTTGPGLQPHPASNTCIERSSNPTAAPDNNTTAPTYCGLELHTTANGIFHVRMVNVTLPEACTLFGGLGGVLGGRGMTPVVDETSLTGRWDITLDFLPERNGPNNPASTGTEDLSGPTFTSAIEKQLGLRLKKGTGTVEDLIIDHIAQPIPD
jgi:uncharacterized protein (TIGR03435 family)